MLRALQAQLLAMAEQVFFEECQEGEPSTRLCEALLPAAALHLLPLVVAAGVPAPDGSNSCRYQVTRLVRLTCRAAAPLHALTHACQRSVAGA